MATFLQILSPNSGKGHYPFIDHLVVKLEDRLVIANEWTKNSKHSTWYQEFSIVHELTYAQEEAIFMYFTTTSVEKFSKSFRREVSCWRVRWCFLKTQTKLCTQTFSYIWWCLSSWRCQQPQLRVSSVSCEGWKATWDLLCQLNVCLHSGIFYFCITVYFVKFRIPLETYM